jgi:hypothetical protein
LGGDATKAGPGKWLAVRAATLRCCDRTQTGRAPVGYVTSRGFKLPDTTGDMDGSMWFNLWIKKLWPYDELEPGDDLYWYESPSRTIVWKTRVTR